MLFTPRAFSLRQASSCTASPAPAPPSVPGHNAHAQPPHHHKRRPQLEAQAQPRPQPQPPQSQPQQSAQQQKIPTPSLSTPAPLVQKYDQHRATVPSNNSKPPSSPPPRSQPTDAMVADSHKRHLSASSPSSTTATTTVSTSPTPKMLLAHTPTPTTATLMSSARPIPASKNQRNHEKHHVRPRPQSKKCTAQRYNNVSPSVAALLAITNIPRHRAQKTLGLAPAPSKQPDESMTVDAIIQRVQRNEKEFSLTLSRNPLDLLLSAPDDDSDGDADGESLSFSDDLDDDLSVAGSTRSRLPSTRTLSDESVCSLDDSFTNASVFSESPSTPGTPMTAFTPSSASSSCRRRTSSVPLRRRLTPVSSPPGSDACTDHPLSSPTPKPSVDELDFRVFEDGQESDCSETSMFSGLPLRPLKSAFKSNLTASLRALRNAARSISNLGMASIPPEDFLTRSILTIDPRVPFTDERRPPCSDEVPTAALRRYLNPTTSARMEPRPATAPTPTNAPTRTVFTASIQMQTYKVRRSRSGSHLSSSTPSPRGMPNPSPQHGSGPASDSADAQTSSSGESGPGAPAGSEAAASGTIPGRQREMRENSDFIRIAVMEMAMRKRGKLSDQRPGRARWALPPRRTSNKPYQIGPDGVPTRWVPQAVA